MSDLEFKSFSSKQPEEPPQELGKVVLDSPLQVDVSTLAKERFGHRKYLKTADGKSEYILDENGRTILLFQGEKVGKFNSVYSPLSRERLARELLALPKEQYTQLRKLLRLPEPTDSDLADFPEIQQRPEEPPQELGKVVLDSPLQVDVSTLAEERFGHGKYLKTADGKSEYILDENGRTILSFQGEKAGKFNSVYSPLSRERLARELLALPKEQYTQLRKLLRLPEPTDSDLADFLEIQRRRAEETLILNETLNLPSGIPEISEVEAPKQDLIRGVLQKEYAVTNGDSEKPVIGTFGLGPCIALTVYDSSSKTAALAHIDATTNVDSLGRIFAEFNDSTDLDVRLIGGDGSSRKLAIQIIQFLRNQGVQISHADILEKPHPSAFVIDARTGDIVPNVTPRDNGEFEDLRMQAAGLEMDVKIKKEFDGR